MKLFEMRELFLNGIEDKILSKSYFVGGSVRDDILNKEPNDFDIAVNKRNGSFILSNLLKKRFGDSITHPVKMSNYPIYTLTFKENIILGGKTYFTEGIVLEISDTMKENYPDPNSRKRNVTFATIEEDRNRRDFSINSVEATPPR